MPTNKNAQLRYQILDRCFSDKHRRYTIDDFLEKVNEALLDLTDREVSLRQICDDETVSLKNIRLNLDEKIKSLRFVAESSLANNSLDYGNDKSN
jgi:nitrogen regulatory protein PII-like uncharacterized protein